MSITPILAGTALLFSFYGGAQTPAQTSHEDLLSFGGGYFDMLDNVEQNKATDYRAEYRFGTPFFGLLKPLAAIEVTSDGAAAVFGGVVADWVIADHWVINPSFAAGYYHQGGGKDMGSPVAFRSQLEAGYRFDNGWRLTGAVSHISNANLGDKNPGADLATVYLHVPVDTLLPR